MARGENSLGRRVAQLRFRDHRVTYSLPIGFFSVSNKNMQVYANAMNTLEIKSILKSGGGSADSNSIPMTPLIIQYPVSSNLP